eukprot:35252-Chlamydomonas_euryale.AAC.1
MARLLEPYRQAGDGEEGKLRVRGEGGKSPWHACSGGRALGGWHRGCSLQKQAEGKLVMTGRRRTAVGRVGVEVQEGGCRAWPLAQQW